MKKTTRLFQGTILSVGLLGMSAVVWAESPPQLPVIQPSSPPAATQNAGQMNVVTWLGVSLSPLPDSVQKQVGSLLGDAKGVLVQKVQPNSPAEKSGVKAFDIFTQFNGQTMNGVDQLNEAIRKGKPGAAIDAKIIRSGKVMPLKITLGEHRFPARPPASQQQQAGRTPFWKRNDLMPGFNGFDNFNGFDQGMPNFSGAPWGNNGSMPWGNNNQFFGNGFPMGGNNFMGGNKSYGQFQSIKVRKGPQNMVRAEVIAKDTTGNNRKFVFEGKKELIYQQVVENKDLPENQKQALIQALDDKLSDNPMNQFMGNPFGGNGSNGFPNFWNGSNPFNFNNGGGNGFNPSRWW